VQEQWSPTLYLLVKDIILWPVVMVALASLKVIMKFGRVSSKVGVDQANENSTWALFNFLFSAKIHKFELSRSVPSKYLSIATKKYSRISP